MVLYKDTSSESEESEEEQVAEPEEEAQEEEPEQATTPVEEPVQQVAVAASRPKRRNRGSWRSSRKRRPAKKSLPKIAEEPEVEMKDKEVDDGESKPLPSPQTNGTAEPMEVDGVPSSEATVKEEPADQAVSEAVSKDEPAEQEATVKSGEVNGVKTESESVKMEEEEESRSVEDVNGENLVKKEEAEEEGKPSPSSASSQRFTVSQLLEKLSNTPAEEGKEDTEGKDPEPESKEETNAEEKKMELETLPEVEDPERSSYDPFVFELIISSVEQLQEWIDKFQDPSPEERGAKARPRCEVKLRERLQSLLEEAQPLAADQQRANQKICQQLWKEWERYRCKSNRGGDQASGSQQGLAAATDSDFTQSDGSDSGEEGSSGSSEDAGSDGLRHSKRLRKRPTNYKSLHDGSTRSSSPAEEEQPPTKQSRKTSYDYDPGWDSDHGKAEEPLPGSSRRQRAFAPEMKNPEYWIGRRMTRATRAFAGDAVADEQMEDSTNEIPSQEQKEGEEAVEQSPGGSGKSSEPLADTLRHLRRQQVLLSSNDVPKGTSTASPSSNASPSPAVFFPSKDSQGKATYIRITNPRAAELLSKLTQSPAPKAADPPAHPRKFFITQQQPPAPPGQPQPPPISFEITHFVSQAVEKGLIVAHEPRTISVDVGEHGHFLVSAQMTPAGPKILGATPLPPKSNNNVPVAPSPATPPAAPPADDVPPPPVPTKETTVMPATNGSSAETAAPPSPGAASAAAAAPNRPVLPVLVTDTKGCSVISPEILKSVAGPDAGDAKLSIVKEGNVKVLTLILSNGEMRRLTKSQVELIQTAIRNSKSGLTSPTTAPIVTAAAEAADAL